MITVLAVLAAIALGLGAGGAFTKRAAKRKYDRLREEYDTEKHINELVVNHLADAFFSYRNLFDHFPAYVKVDRNIDELLFRLAGMVAIGAKQLPRVLMYAAPPADCPEPLATPADSLYSDGDVRMVELLVGHINDPVLKELWAARTPSALCEMVRHAFFLGFGYPNAVVGSTLEGVNITVHSHAVTPGNYWGARSMERLAEEAHLWNAWRKFWRARAPQRG